MSSLLLQATNLSIAIQHRKKQIYPVKGIDFSISSGETVALVGESGCGKSVTALSIMGLLSRRTTCIHGSLSFYGRELTHLTERQYCSVRGKEIGMVFQDPMTSLNPTMRIGNQIAEAIRLHRRVNKGNAWDQAAEILGKVRIPEPRSRMSQYPHQLSGGMRQRVVLAIALACRPKLLIADEPTTALDVTIQAQILELLSELQQEFQMGVLLITHDLGIVAGMCDRVLVMYAGRLVEAGRVDQVFGSPQHPYTRALLAAVPQQNQEVLATIPGAPPSPWEATKGCPFAARCPYAMQVCTTHPPAFQTINTRSIPLYNDSNAQAMAHKTACWLHDSRARQQHTLFTQEAS